MNGVLTACRRALGAQFSGRMLLLSLAPLLLALALWGVAMWLGLQPLLDWLHGMFADYGGFETSGSMLEMVGLGMLKVMVVPLVAIVLLLPLMIGSALLFVGVAAMPAIEAHVGKRQFPGLAKKEGGSFFGSVAINLGSTAVFALLWLFTLPLYAVPPLAWLVQASLWAWVTSRVMSYDALAAHASEAERLDLMRRRRPALLAIGFTSGLAGALPGIVWMGGAVLSIVLFPILALVSLWLYVMIFLFAGLWFQYYCLQALEELRAEAVTQPA
ncbi:MULTISPECIES: EI24 domain-containing protein [Massilia]|uniref:Membrane protein n=1 Tax=Massilia aurea TaxID=373040 RepID=A0A422QPT9_9BURK|nr:MULTISPECIES: EI24 domain-containing protein [Massilia]MDY0962749.1 EI24 domain-containing protein [Massilia sp. CFBP9026]RNF31801.1 membrane protein [Massilia aurea]